MLSCKILFQSSKPRLVENSHISLINRDKIQGWPENTIWGTTKKVNHFQVLFLQAKTLKSAKNHKQNVTAFLKTSKEWQNFEKLANEMQQKWEWMESRIVAQWMGGIKSTDHSGSLQTQQIHLKFSTYVEVGFIIQTSKNILFGKQTTTTKQNRSVADTQKKMEHQNQKL